MVNGNVVVSVWSSGDEAAGILDLISGKRMAQCRARAIDEHSDITVITSLVQQALARLLSLPGVDWQRASQLDLNLPHERALSPCCMKRTVPALELLLLVFSSILQGCSKYNDMFKERIEQQAPRNILVTASHQKLPTL